MIRILTVLLFVVSTFTAMADFTKSIAGGKLIYGDKVSSKDLKGKVILLEYWGLN